MPLSNRNNFLRWRTNPGGSIPVDNEFGYDLDSAVEKQTLNVNSVESILTGFFWKSNGTKFYITGISSNQIHEYICTTAWEISTAYLNNSQSITANPTDMYFTPDGTEVHVLYYNGSSSITIRYSTLSTPWDLSSIGSETAQVISGLGQWDGDFDTMNAMTFNDDGTKLIVVGQVSGFGNPDSGAVIWNLTTPYRTSARSFANNGINISDSSDYNTEQPRGLYKPPNNPFIYMVGNDRSIQKIVYTNESSFGSVLQSLSGSTGNDVFIGKNGRRIYDISTTEVITQWNTGGNEEIKYGNQSQFDGTDSASIYFVPGDTFSFYANLDTLDDSSNFANYRLDLVDRNWYTQAFNVATLTQDVISGSDFRFYVDGGTIPYGITGECYRFVIIDTTDNDNLVAYFSNIFNIMNTPSYTKLVRFRNEKNTLNYNYETLTSFKNQFRLKLVQRNPTYPTVRDGYPLVDGAFNPVINTSGQQFEFLTDNYHADDLEAWNAATLQSLEIFNETNQQWELFRRAGDSTLDIEWNYPYPFGDATINLERVDSYNSIDNV